MPTHWKYPIFSLLITFSLCSSAIAETNFDFFFKNDNQYKDVIVKEVRSTDTLVLQAGVGERGEVIKLIGLKAPAPPKIQKKNTKRDEYGFTTKEAVSPLTPLEERAYHFAKDLLEGQHVRLEFDVEKRGEDNKTLAYIFLLKDNTFANTEILRHGYAHLSLQTQNKKYINELRSAYREARNEKRGLQGQ